MGSSRKLRHNQHSSTNNTTPNKGDELTETTLLNPEWSLKVGVSFESKSPSNEEFLGKKRKSSNSNSNLKSSEKKIKNPFITPSIPTSETKVTSYYNKQKKSNQTERKFSSTRRDKLNQQNTHTSKHSYMRKLDFGHTLINKNEYLPGLNFQFEGSMEFYNRVLKFYANRNKLHLDKSSIKPESFLSESTLNVINRMKMKGLITDFTSRPVRKNLSSNLNVNFRRVEQFVTGNIMKKSTNIKSPTKSKVNSPSLKQLMTSYSIKDKYSELLKRELVLPCHYKTLFSKFIQLDETIGELRKQKKCTTLSNISQRIEFTREDFQSILFICPHFFIYKWDHAPAYCSCSNHIREDVELFIDIPKDILKRFDTCYDLQTNFFKLQTFPYIPYISYPIEKEIRDKRTNTFKKVLLHMTNEHHKQFLQDRNIKVKLNPYKHRTWHSDFDVHKVPPIDKFNLVEPRK